MEEMSIPVSMQNEYVMDFRFVLREPVWAVNFFLKVIEFHY